MRLAFACGIAKVVTPHPRHHMPHLWIEDIPGEWAIMPLAAARVVLHARDGWRAAATPASDPMLVLVRGGDTPPTWHALAPHDAPAWVNGLPLVHGLRVLNDRDEIRTCSGETFYFSTEEPARVEPMPAAPAPVACPRCREPVEAGSPAVRCPQCTLWNHQSDRFPCWTYGDTCAMCPQPTTLDGSYRWSPMEL